MLLCLQFDEYIATQKSYDYKLNDESTETDQFMARIHGSGILNESLVLGDVITP